MEGIKIETKSTKKTISDIMKEVNTLAVEEDGKFKYPDKILSFLKEMGEPDPFPSTCTISKEWKHTDEADKEFSKEDKNFIIGEHDNKVLYGRLTRKANKSVFIFKPTLHVADTHGDIDSSKKIIEKVIDDKGCLRQDIVVLNHGDILDRGKYTIKNLLFWLKLRKYYPDNVMLLRGNHETETIWKRYGEEWREKFPSIDRKNIFRRNLDVIKENKSYNAIAYAKLLKYIDKKNNWAQNELEYLEQQIRQDLKEYDPKALDILIDHMGYVYQNKELPQHAKNLFAEIDKRISKDSIYKNMLKAFNVKVGEKCPSYFTHVPTVDTFLRNFCNQMPLSALVMPRDTKGHVRTRVLATHGAPLYLDRHNIRILRDEDMKEINIENLRKELEKNNLVNIIMYQNEGGYTIVDGRGPDMEVYNVGNVNTREKGRICIEGNLAEPDVDKEKIRLYTAYMPRSGRLGYFPFCDINPSYGITEELHRAFTLFLRRTQSKEHNALTNVLGAKVRLAPAPNGERNNDTLLWNEFNSSSEGERNFTRVEGCFVGKQVEEDLKRNGIDMSVFGHMHENDLEHPFYKTFNSMTGKPLV